MSAMMVLRRRALLVAAVLLLSILRTASSPAAAEELTGGDLDRFVRSQMDRLDVPGVAYAVVGTDGVLHSGTLGVTGDDEPVSASTPFLWGSLSKTAAATVVMTLVEDGVLVLDAPVLRYLPDFRLADPVLTRQVTVRQLLSHTSGVPTSVRFTDRYDAGRRPRDVLPALREVEPVATPGTEFHYSSVNYLVLAAAVEEVTGERFGVVLERRMLDPLGMSGTVTSAQEAARLPAGHRYVFGRPTAFSTPYDPAGLAYGYLGGTLRDATAWARAALGGGRGVLTATQRAAMFPDLEAGEETAYGLGWRRWPLGDRDSAMLWHGGAAPGYQAALILLPAEDRAVVVLQNVYGVFADRTLLDTAFGLAAIVSGGEPQTTEAGLTYPVVLAVLGGLIVVLLGCLLASVRRLLGGPRRRSARRTILSDLTWLVGLGALGSVVGVLLPAAAGVRLGQVVLWAPDVAWLAWGILVVATLVGAIRVTGVLRGLAGRSRSRHAAAGAVAREGSG